jgi:Uma2 family endonuclease
MLYWLTFLVECGATRGMVEKQIDTLTGDELLNLPGGMGQRYELIKGELITMAPSSYRHTVVAACIIILLGDFVKKHKLGRISS